MFPPTAHPVRRFLSLVLLVLWVEVYCPLVLPAAAQTSPRTEHRFTFGQSLTVTLVLPAESTAQEVRLFLRGNNTTEIQEPPIAEGQAQYQRDLRQQPLAPFTTLTYWWEYQTPDGTQQTEPTTFLYEDNRYQWETLAEGDLTIKWISGPPELMVSALDITRNAQEEITARLKSPPLGPVTIYIYPSQSDLQLALRLTGREWVGGEAHPEVGVILVAISASDQALTQMQQLLPHELTHLILYRRLTPAGYDYLPTWLNEGLASYFEQRPDPRYAVALERAREANQLLPLNELCTPFYSRSSDQVILAYAQSQSLVTYLHETYGWSGLRAVLHTYSDGLSCAAGLEKELGIGLTTLERDWRVWLEPGGQSLESQQHLWATGRLIARDLAPWFFLLLLILLPGLLFLFTGRAADTK